MKNHIKLHSPVATYSKCKVQRFINHKSNRYWGVLSNSQATVQHFEEIELEQIQNEYQDLFGNLSSPSGISETSLFYRIMGWSESRTERDIRIGQVIFSNFN